MLLDSLSGHLFPVEDTGSQGSLSIGRFRDLEEVFFCACIAGSDDRDGNYTPVLFAK